MTDEELVEAILDAPPWDRPILKWHLQRREAQTCPDPQPFIWFLLGGRGSGKTWTSANHIWEYSVKLERMPKNDVRIALVGETFEDVRLTMVEGETGLLQVIPEELKPTWNRTQGELKVILPGPPYREIIFKSYTSERPEKLRGPQFHGAWLDEPAKFKDCNEDPMGIGTTWNNLFMGLRLGPRPHVVVSGTPTPCRLVKYLVAEGKTTKMITWDNRDNLAEEYFERLTRLKPDSRQARQEIYAEILLDNPDSLFTQEAIEESRANVPEGEGLLKVLGYDPSASSAADADETGIVLTGYTPEVRKRQTGTAGGHPTILQPSHAYILKDLSGHYTPAEQINLIMDTIFKDRVDDLVYEQNQGVEFVQVALEQALKEYTDGQYKIRKSTKMKRTEYGNIKRFYVSALLRNGDVHKFTISAIHAKKNKHVRAETASFQYDSGRVHHPINEDALPTCEIDACRTNLESQMTSWNPKTSKASPDRLDALVYTLLFIFGDRGMRKGTVQVSAPQDPVTQQNSQHGAVKQKRYASLYSVDVMNSGVENDRPSIPSSLDRSSLLDIPGDSLYSLRLVD